MGANTHAANFERSSSQYAYRASGDCVGVNMTGDRAFHFWMKLNSLPSTGEIYVIASVWNVSASSNWLLTLRDVAGTKYFTANIMNGSSNAGVRWNASALTLTDWNHFAWVLDISEAQATENEAWFNGVSQGNGTIFVANELSSTSAPAVQFRLAAWTPDTNYLDGRLDCFAVYDAMISEAEIQARMYQQPDPAWDDIQAGYIFDGEVWTDVCEQNDLTPVNSPTFVTDVPFTGSTPLLIGLQMEEQMAKTQFVSGEDLIITFPPFIDKTTGERIVGTDVATLVVKKPDDTLMGTPPTASFDTDIDMWRATIAKANFEEGEWLVKASTNDTDGLDQYLSYTWGDYVDDIPEARQAALGRWKIDGTQLKLYEEDGITILRTFDLKDSDGNATNTRIFERDPV